MSSRRLLISAALLGLAASAAAAQTAPMALWSADRPDAVAPIGVFGDRLQGAGSLQLTVFYSRTGAEGIRFGSELIDPATLFGNFELVPLSLSSDGYFVRAQYGINDRVTLAAEGGFVRRTREQITQDLVFFPLEAEGPTDIRAQLLFNLFDTEAVKAHVHLGGSAPVGSTNEADGETGLRTAGTLPYDMQLGSGGWGVSPGITAKVMNEYGSVGGQVIGTMYFGSKNGWRAGDQVEMTGWAAYRLNRFFSVSAGAHMVSFETIQGFDPALNPDRDPGELPISFGGKRVDLPVGVNLYMPEGSWAGHRISVEFNFPVHEDFEGPWLAGKRGLTIGWQKAF
jgi:hypothetical protein